MPGAPLQQPIQGQPWALFVAAMTTGNFNNPVILMTPPFSSMEHEKRVRKKTKRLSESERAGEGRKGRRKRDEEKQVPGTRKKATREVAKKRQRVCEQVKELLVSFQFAGGELTLSGVAMTELVERRKPKLIVTSQREATPTNGASEGAFPRRTMETQFKNPKFMCSYLASNKKKTWKNLKQILVAERAQCWRVDDPTYGSIDAPPPLKPAKKYADISGLPARYTDPLTGIYYSTLEEFQMIRSLPSDIAQGYLALRGKVSIS